jgi:hypothetical protein
VADRWGAALDGALAGGQQDPDGLTVTAASGLGQMLAAQCLSGRAGGIQVIAVCPVASGRAGRTVDLHHPLALLQQVGGQARSEAASALDRPPAPAWGVLQGEAVDALVAEGVGWDGPVGDHRADRVHDRGRVAVFVGVHADDVVDLVCEHGVAAS